MQAVTVSTLKSFEALKNVPDDELQWLIDNSANRFFKDGEYLTIQGQPLGGPHFVIDGHIVLYTMQNGSRREITSFKKGDVTGYLPFSRGVTASANSQADGDVQMMSFPTDRVRELIKDHFEITQALVHVMSNRVREFTALQQQNEKMMALGKLSAGLAHELNNPASAIVRDSATLLEHLQMQPETFKKVISIQMTVAQVDAVNDELFRLLAVKDLPALTLKEKTNREDEIAGWLEERNVENSYDMAENFVEFGFELANLETFCSHIPEAYCSPVFNWINNLLTTERMVQDIQESSRRIAELVQSVKLFTHMDRGFDKQRTDIRFGIKNSLMMLKHRFRKGNIELVKDFDENLPEVNAMVGELNQVWTNLIDNALDAMEPNGRGTLTISTRRNRQFAQVTITDDGPGIPNDIKTRIFDPFFTTKEVGKGTGMGLEVVQRIVRQHNGTIKVESKPGKTEFLVCFPID
ncbi:MAG TPA: ATP-binding protein [Mucilaginibacter sp.]|jgi:signal transduction histidine kinase|nr:ATP-binding protein [Mucilaginibacter sp.]